MTETKYGKHILREPFITATPEFGGAKVFGYDDRDNIGIIYEYHCINREDWTVAESRVSDTWELMCFLGGDPREIADLGAQVNFCLGNDNEEYNLSGATVVTIPPGMKHGPVSVQDYNSPLVFLRIATTKEYEERKTAGGKTNVRDAMREGSRVTMNGHKHWMNIVQGPFYKQREPGYLGTSISATHDEYGSGVTLGYHGVSPVYNALTPHAHNHPELLCFLGGDPEDVYNLNADVTVTLGEEQEEHAFNTATIVSIPTGLKHCPVKIRNITKPMVFMAICTAGEKVDIW